MNEKKYHCTCPKCGSDKQSRKRDVGKQCRKCNMQSVEVEYRHKRVKIDAEKFSHREYSLKKKYNLSLADYDILLEAQNYSCAICGTHVSKASLGSGNHLHVDHNHINGEVRGLLCWDCNTGIGKMKDSVTILQSAINYIQIRGSYA